MIIEHFLTYGRLLVGFGCMVLVWAESGVTVTYTIRVRVTPGSNPGSPMPGKVQIHTICCCLYRSAVYPFVFVIFYIIYLYFCQVFSPLALLRKIGVLYRCRL